MCALVSVAEVSAQIRTGSISGVVEDPAGARVAGQPVDVADPATGQRWHAVTDASGTFAVAPLPYGRYTLTVRPPAGFRAFTTDAVVRSNLPTVVRVALLLAGFDDSQVISAQQGGDLPLTTRSELRVNVEMAVLPPQRSTSLASLIAAAPGVARAHNALVHVRGVEDGLLYVVDGVPVTERYDALHASAFDSTRSTRSRSSRETCQPSLAADRARLSPSTARRAGALRTRASESEISPRSTARRAAGPRSGQCTSLARSPRPGPTGFSIL